LGTSPRIEHVPSRQADRGPVTASYAVANFRSFGQVFRVCEQIDLDRARSVSQNTSPDSPWKMWPEAMAAKTAILRLRSLIPVDSQVADLWAMVNQTEADEAEDKAPTIEAVTVEAVPQRSPFADLPPETEDVAEPDQPAQTSEITAEDIDAAMSRAAKVNQR
jgi:recombinational DNA repair protein RecT